jgi:hypothetical protein
LPIALIGTGIALFGHAKQEEAMATQAISVERRQHSREGILGQLENITYTVLRKYGITGETIRETVMNGAPQEVRASERQAHRTALGCLSGLLPVVPPIVQENQGQSRPGKEGTSMTANLFVVVSNPQPNRERHYPDTWLLYTRGHDPLEVHVAHDSLDRPHVLDKRVA